MDLSEVPSDELVREIAERRELAIVVRWQQRAENGRQPFAFVVAHHDAMPISGVVDVLRSAAASLERAPPPGRS